MRRVSISLAGGFVFLLVGVTPAHALWHVHSRSHGYPVVPVAPLVPLAPAQPLTFMQVVQGVQLLQSGIHILTDLQQQRPGGTQQTQAPCRVSAEVVSTLDRVDNKLADIVKSTDELKVRDTEILKKYPDLNKPLDVSKPRGGGTGGGTAGEGKTLRPPG
jgi:hypothetical protein